MTTDSEADTLKAFIAEMETYETPLTMVLRPLVAFQLASLLQLASRHPGIGDGDNRRTAFTFIEHVRQYFREAPTVEELLRHGNDPAFDVHTPPPVALTPSQRMALADILLTTIRTPGHTEVHVDVTRDVVTTPEELLALMIEPDALYDVARRVMHDVGLPWTDPRTGQTHPPPPPHGLALRLRYRVLGGHVHCRVFTGPTINETFVKAGELTFTVAEWPALFALLAPVVDEFLPEDE